jgi:hypothetical protein
VVSRALRYLKRLQRRNGSIRYSKVSSQTPVWVTAQALMALRRKPLPIRPVPRNRRRRASAAAAVAPRPVAPRDRQRPAPRRRPASPSGSRRFHRAEPSAAVRAVDTRRSSAGENAAVKEGGSRPAWLLAAGALVALAAILGFRVYLRRRRTAAS